MQGGELEMIVTEKRKRPVEIRELIEIKTVKIDRVSEMVFCWFKTPMFHVSLIEG
jgi:hypothetical protein